MSQVQQKNRKRKHISDGIFKAELHAFFSRALPDAGYSGFELTNTVPKPEIILKITNAKPLLDDNQRKIRELESMIQKRFDYKQDGIHIKVQRLRQKGLCAAAMAESIKLKLLAQMPVRVAVNSVIRTTVDKEKAKGCEVIISGKLSQQRAKSMKFKKGYMISSGQVKDDYLETAIRHVFLKQGVMGVKVKIMKEYDPKNIQCASVPLPDFVEFLDTKKDEKEQQRITTRAADVQ
jgi:small subunit ribosomal protein S3e